MLSLYFCHIQVQLGIVNRFGQRSCFRLPPQLPFPSLLISFVPLDLPYSFWWMQSQGGILAPFLTLAQQVQAVPPQSPVCELIATSTAHVTATRCSGGLPGQYGCPDLFAKALPTIVCSSSCPCFIQNLIPAVPAELFHHVLS